MLRQNLTSFSVLKQGTRLSKSSTASRLPFPTAISHLFSMKISFLMIYITTNPHHDLGLHKQEVSLLLSETTFLLFFFDEERKCIVNNVEWEIPNDNIARDSNLEETEYTGY